MTCSTIRAVVCLGALACSEPTEKPVAVERGGSGASVSTSPTPIDAPAPAQVDAPVPPPVPAVPAGTDFIADAALLFRIAACGGMGPVPPGVRRAGRRRPLQEGAQEHARLPGPILWHHAAVLRGAAA